jgi:phosphoglycerate dehydrogenase-like enzyme
MPKLYHFIRKQSQTTCLLIAEQPVELVFRRVVSSLTSRPRAVATPYEKTPFHKAEGPFETGMTVKICIVGCGALGSVIAAHLARLDDVEVYAYDVSEAHTRAIN